MKKDTPILSFVLLGLINLHPSISGYELKANMDRSIQYFYSTSLSQIYPTLKTLFEEGLVTFNVEPLLGKQDRKVYTITNRGREALRARFQTPLRLEPSLDSFQSFLLRLCFCDPLERATIVQFLQNGLEHYQKEERAVTRQHLSYEIQFLDPSQQDFRRSLALWKHELDYVNRELRLRIDFLQELIEEVENQSEWDAEVKS